MPLITLSEILYMVILTLVVGYIFSDRVTIRPKTVYDMMHPRRLTLENLKFAALVTAPGIILHELSHKFTAMSFGYTAQFFIWPTGLVVALVLKLISSPLILIAPGYVNLPLITNQFQYRLIAFAGPAINLLLFLIASILIKVLKNPSKKTLMFLALTKQINLILFIFNMIPIPPLDGSKVLFGPSL